MSDVTENKDGKCLGVKASAVFEGLEFYAAGF